MMMGVKEKTKKELGYDLLAKIHSVVSSYEYSFLHLFLIFYARSTPEGIVDFAEIRAKENNMIKEELIEEMISQRSIKILFS